MPRHRGHPPKAKFKAGSTKVSARLNAVLLFPAALQPPGPVADAARQLEVAVAARVLAGYLCSLLGPRDLLALFTATGCTRHPTGHQQQQRQAAAAAAAGGAGRVPRRPGVRGSVWHSAPGPQTWWAASLTAAALGRGAPLHISGSQRPATAAWPGLLLTAEQAAHAAGGDGGGVGGRGDDDRCTDGGSVHVLEDILESGGVDQHSDEHVYPVAHLADLGHRVLRKACTRVAAAVVGSDTEWAEAGSSWGGSSWGALRVCVHPGPEVTQQVVISCQRCRNRWATARTAAAISGLPKRHYYLAALSAQARRGHVGEVVLFRLHRPAATALGADLPHGDPNRVASLQDTVAYLVVERAGNTLVSVDGCHDYSFGDPRGDPSAYLLHVAATWWLARTEGRGGGGGDGAPAPAPEQPPDAAAAAGAAGAAAAPPLPLPLPPLPPPPPPGTAAGSARGDGVGPGAVEFFNDGPVPTAGLRAYKAQYRGFLIKVCKGRRPPMGLLERPA